MHTLRFPESNLPVRNPDFVGREKLKAKVREFVSRPGARGYLVLVGGMGQGKTSFLADFIYDEIERGRQPICHFIDYHPSITGDRQTIALSLFGQLRCK